MKHVDYIVVGCGLAGIAFCEQLRAHRRSHLVFDDGSQKSSSVAVGLYNPVVLKRFTKVWKAKEQLELAIPKYRTLEQLLGITLDHKRPVYRKFASIEEQNQWFAASDKPSLESFLSAHILKNTNPKIRAPFGFGEVLQTGRIDTTLLIKHYRTYLENEEQLIQESFDSNALTMFDHGIEYKGTTAKHIVFAEGFGVVNNPYFNNLPLRATKGEIITIKAPELKLDVILKASVFIVPLGQDLYAVGATYNWDDKTNLATEEAKLELVKKLNSVISCEFEILKQSAGIRPTVKDRKPLVGVHSMHKNLFVLNGLGTRGVMMAPYIAEQLFSFIEKDRPLEKVIDIKRFSTLPEEG